MGKLAFIIAFISGLIAAFFKFKDNLFKMKAQKSNDDLINDISSKQEKIEKIEKESQKIEKVIDNIIEKNNKEAKKLAKTKNVESLTKEFDKW